MRRATVDATAHTPSLWNDTLPDAQRCHFEPLPGDSEFDVVIVGAGLTGAWTGYYLAGADPTLRIGVLERATVGFGASGRNGGWCSALLPMNLTTVGRRHGRDAAIALAAGDARHRRRGRPRRRRRGDRLPLHEGRHDRSRPVVTAGRPHPRRARRVRRVSDSATMTTDGSTPTRRAGTAPPPHGRGALFTPHCAVVHPARLIHGSRRRRGPARRPVLRAHRRRSASSHAA